MAQQNTIVSAQEGGITKYLQDSKMGPDKKRRPVLTTSIERAKRFWNAADAYNYYTYFVDGNKYQFKTETYQQPLKDELV
jgi:hypothetical protein